MTLDLASLGWDARFAADYADLVADGGAWQVARADHWPARVVRVDRGVCTLVADRGRGAGGTHRASLGGGLLARCGRDPAALPAAGDWVVARAWPDGRTTIEAVLPRRSAVVPDIAGGDPRGRILAANLDVAAVVESLAPAPDLGRVARLLALAGDSGAAPLVVLTKADRVARPGPAAARVARIADGVEVVVVGAGTGGGLARLRPLVVPGRTLGLLGAPGSGKSTIVNALAGAVVMTNRARRADGRGGRRATTYGVLVPVPGGGAVLDTPGAAAAGLPGPDGGRDARLAAGSPPARWWAAGSPEQSRRWDRDARGMRRVRDRRA